MTDIAGAALRGIESVKWDDGDLMVDLARELREQVAEAAAREVLAEVARVLVDHYPDPSRPYTVVDVGARLGIRAVADALGIDLDAAMTSSPPAEPEMDSDDENLVEHTARAQGGLADALEQYARSELAKLDEDPDLPHAPIAEGPAS